MKHKLPLFFASVAGLLTVCGPVLAHHGSAAYADKLIVLKQATVTKFAWANPHSIVMFDVKDDRGNDVHWAGEAGSPSALGLIGWSKSSVQPGDVITVYMFPARSGKNVGRLNKIVLADGTELHDSQLGGDKYGADKPAQ
jgi:Family of unknown function (DUF6152)